MTSRAAISLLASPSLTSRTTWVSVGVSDSQPLEGRFAFPATALGVAERRLDRQTCPLCTRGAKSFLPQCLPGRFHCGVIANLVHREAGDAFVIADRSRGPKQARRVLVRSIAGGQSRQTLQGIGHPQKRPSVRGGRQRVMGVARGLSGFALGQGDEGARG